jgi:hypothetical protein
MSHQEPSCKFCEKKGWDWIKRPSTFWETNTIKTTKCEVCLKEPATHAYHTIHDDRCELNTNCKSCAKLVKVTNSKHEGIVIPHDRYLGL